jgi:hypothetical protein
MVPNVPSVTRCAAIQRDQRRACALHGLRGPACIGVARQLSFGHGNSYLCWMSNI